jgi:hypothetical protein
MLRGISESRSGELGRGIPHFIDCDLSGVGQDETHQHGHGGGLSGTVGAEQPEDLAPGNLEIEVVDYLKGTERLSEILCSQHEIGVSPPATSPNRTSALNSHPTRADNWFADEVTALHLEIPLSDQPPVIIRQSTRHDVVLRALVAFSQSQDGKACFSSQAGARDGWTDADLLDISGGGLGLITRLFIPRRALIRVRLFESEEMVQPMIEVQARVQRVVMTDRRPAYLLGASIEGLTSQELEGLDRFLRRLNDEDGGTACRT